MRLLQLLLLVSMLTRAEAFAQEPEGQTSEKWEHITSEDGIDVFRAEMPGNPIPAFKGESVIDASLIRVASVIADTNRAKEWMDDLEEIKVLEQKSEYEKIVFSLFKSPVPILAHDRSMLQKLTVKLDVANKSLIFSGTSIVDSRYPEDTDSVRANNLGTQFILRSEDLGKKTSVVFWTRTDPKGSLPNWLWKSVQKEWPVNTIRNLSKQARKQDIQELPYLKSLIDVLNQGAVEARSEDLERSHSISPSRPGQN